jgi:hypothetical protein
MSHPGAISCRCSLTISRSRRRMRLRRTAVPSAFFTLQPNRLKSRPFGRRKTVNSQPARLRPSLYTASYSARRSNRHDRGKSNCDDSDPRETVASLFAALRKNSSPARALHACAKSVLFVTGAHMGLKRTFRQRSLSSSCKLGGRSFSSDIHGRLLISGASAPEGEAFAAAPLQLLAKPLSAHRGPKRIE